MFQFATSILTLISLAGHVLLGCCAHHAHTSAPAPACASAEGCPRNEDAAVARNGHACGCRAHQVPQAPQCEQPAGGCGSHEPEEPPCDGPVCQYLAPDVVKAPDASLPDLARDLVPVEECAAAAGCASLRECVDFDASPAGFRDGARLHALMAVWLL